MTDKKKWHFYVLRGLGVALLAVFFIVDRLIVSFFITKDMPGIREFLRFKHEQERFKTRYGLYAFIFVVYLIVKLLIAIFS